MVPCSMRFVTVTITIIFLYTPALCQYSCTSCPLNCQCTEWDTFLGCYVDCTFGNLDEVPTLKVPNTIIFNISRNHLERLTDDSFSSSSTDIKNLDLSHNLIVKIKPKTFHVFKELEILNLGNNALESFPNFLPLSLKILKLNSNKFSYFDVESLMTCGATNLKSLFFDSNDIEEIAYDPNDLLDGSSNSLQEISFRNNKMNSINQLTFAIFRKLKYLSLNENFLESISADAFLFNSDLEILDLSNNRIRSILPGTFENLSKLKYLSLSGNELTLFPEVPLLEWLDISFNKIKKIPEDDRSKVFPPEVVLLGGNPLHCDCDMLWLKEFYDSREYKLNYVNIDRKKFIPICGSPQSVAKESWDLLSSALFQCGGLEEKSQSLNIFDLENSKESSQESSPIEIKVTEVNEKSVKVYWNQYRRPNDILLKFYKSSHRYIEEEISIEPSQVNTDFGMFLLEQLEPNTEYVVCLTVQFRMSTKHITHSGCLKVRTKGSLSYLQGIVTEGLQCSDLVLISLLCVVFGYWMHRLVEMRTTDTVDKSDKVVD